MYVQPNFKTKKALREAVARGEIVTVWQPGPFSASCPQNGRHAVEGPHYPQPHTWYAGVVLQDGRVVEVR